MANTAAKRPFYLRDAAQLEALRSPARHEIVDGLQALGPCSIAELAVSIGRAPDSLYYHVRALERVGLIVRRGSRASGAREEALYDTPGRLVIDHQPKTGRDRRTLTQLTGALLRIAERDFRAAVESGVARNGRTAQRNTWCGRMKGWLTRDELAEVREHLEALSQLVSRGSRRPGAELHALAFSLAPLTPSPRAQSRRKSSGARP